MSGGGIIQARSTKEEVVGGLVIGCVLGIVAFVVSFLALFFVKGWFLDLRAGRHRPWAQQQPQSRRPDRNARPRMAEA